MDHLKLKCVENQANIRKPKSWSQAKSVSSVIMTHVHKQVLVILSSPINTSSFSQHVLTDDFSLESPVTGVTQPLTTGQGLVSNVNFSRVFYGLQWQ